MNHRRLFSTALPLFVVGASLAIASPAFAHDGPEPDKGPANDAPAGPSGEAAPAGTSAQADTQLGVVKDQAQTSEKKEAEEKKLPFRGSTLLFDQSVTTQTAHLDTSPQQSYVPLYEWWFSFRPKWYFTDHISYTMRVDFYKEIGTNAEETDKYQEDVFGDIWNTFSYKTPLAKEGRGKNTNVGVSALFKLPTSKESQANGIYVTAGAGASISQKIPLGGEDAKAFNDFHVGLSGLYQHPFSRATEPTGIQTDVARQDTQDRSFLSDQVRGSTLTNHQVIGILDTGIQLTPKLSFTADMIFINGWKYAPTSVSCVNTSTGCAGVPRQADNTTFTQSTWFLTSLDYDIFDEVSLGLGYYNLQNLIAPDGQRRGIFGGDNVWWSPDARVFFDITANLDKIYESVSGHKASTETKKAQGTTPEQKAQTILRSQNF